MNSLKRDPGKRNIFDVHIKRKWRGNTLNLRPPFYRRHPWISFLILVGMAVLSFLGIERLYTRAEVTDFYPSTCLGSWQKTANAQGKPEMLTDATNVAGFSVNNSSVWSGGDTGIYCGNFVPPNYQTSGDITHVGLTLVWQIEGIPTSTAESASTTTPANPATTTATTTSFAPLKFLFAQFISPAFADDDSSSVATAAPANDTTTPAAAPPPTPPPPTPAPTSSVSSTPSAPAPEVPAATSTAEPTSASSSTASSSAEATTSVATTSTETATGTVDLGPPLVASLSTSTPSGTLTAASSSATSTAATSTMPTPLPPPPPDLNFLRVSYSTDGETWIDLGLVNAANWPDFTVTLPITDWNDLKNLQIRVKGLATTQDPAPTVYLDGMLIEVHYDIPPVTLSGEGSSNPPATLSSEPPPVIVSVPAAQNPVPTNQGGFRANEAPSFEMNLGDLPAASSTVASSSAASTTIESTTAPTSTGATTSPGVAASTTPIMPASTTPTSTPSSTSFLGVIFSRLALFVRPSFFLSKLGLSSASADTIPADLPTQSNPVVAKILDPDGASTSLTPITLLDGNILHISLPQAGRDFRPGRYKLELWVWKDNVVYYSESGFDWGVLAVNLSQSVYALGDTAQFSFAVLTDEGDTVCDADLAMTVTSPGGATYPFSTKDGSISRNSTCGPRSVTNAPDYSAKLPLSQAGTYQMTVTSNVPSGGEHQVTDQFMVEAAPSFEVMRTGPTRIFPPATYQMKIRVKADADYSGNITEEAPSSFLITNASGAVMTDDGSEKTLTWTVNLKAGDVQTFSYSFNAPNISPELYRLGPLTIGSWSETREWQIAADSGVNLVQRGSQDMGSNTSVSVSLPTSIDTSRSFIRIWLGVGNSSAPEAYQIEAYFDTQGTSVNHFTLARYGTETGITVYWQVVTMTNISVQHVNNISFSAGVVSSTQTISALSGLNKAFALVTGRDNSATSGHGYDGFFSAGITSTTTVDVVRGGSDDAGQASLQVVQFTDGTTVEHHSIAVTGTGGNTTLTNSVNPSVAFVIYSYNFTVDSLCDNPLVEVTAATTLNITRGASCDNSTVEAYVVNMAGVSTAYATGANITATITTTTISNVVSTSTAFTYLQLTNSGKGSTWANELAGASLDATSSATIYKNTTKNTTAWVLQTIQLPIIGAPSASNVVLNNGSNITLTPNATTTVTVVASTTDTNGAANISYATGTIYRTSLGTGCAADSRDCYQIASASCSFSGSTSTVTCSAPIWYFAQSTGNASSSFPSDSWTGAITVTDASANTATATSSAKNVNVLTAINVTTSSISYGTITPSSTTSSTNQTTVVQDVGNSSTTLKISGTALTKGSNLIATSSQHYATSSFAFGGNEQQLSDTATTVSGFLLPGPTSTSAVQKNLYWGLSVPQGEPTGTYNGTVTFTAAWSQ